jgi:uncharacterized protein (TIGR03067 family)
MCRFITLLTVAAVLSKPIPDTGKAKARTDADNIQGTWQIVDLIIRGKKVLEFEGQMVTFAGDKMTIVNHNSYSFKLDEHAKPKSIDLTTLEIFEGEKSPGIYRFDGDRLQLCWPNKLADEIIRPKQFAAPTDSANVLITLKRVKKN